MSEFRGHSFVIKAGMMKATSLKRLAALEQAAIPNTRPPLRLTEVRRFAHYDQSAFWNEDQTVLSRYGLFDGPVPPGSLRVLVITVHPTSREDWLVRFGLDDDDELEAFEERRIVASMKNYDVSERRKPKLSRNA